MGSERRLGPIPPGLAGNGLDTFQPLVQTPHMITDTTTTHPGRIRGTENLHILLWIVKDTCWVQDYRLAGVLMILPTISVAIYLTAQARAQRDEFIHNLAVVFWLCANSVWMIGEFFFDDHTRTCARLQRDWIAHPGVPLPAEMLALRQEPEQGGPALKIRTMTRRPR